MTNPKELIYKMYPDHKKDCRNEKREKQWLREQLLKRAIRYLDKIYS